MEHSDLSLYQWPAILLVGGGVLFWIGAFYPPYRQWMTSDTTEYLTIVAAHKINWYIIHGFFLLGIIVTVVGVQLFAQALMTHGMGSIYASVGSTLFIFGAAFWIINIAFRVTVTIWAADRLTSSGTLYESFRTWMDWSGILFSIYMVLAYAAIGFLGLAAREIVPAWVSWFSIIFGFLGIIGYLIRLPIYAPPLMVHLPFMITGVMILLALKKGG